jgi:hypothetical protein
MYLEQTPYCVSIRDPHNFPGRPVRDPNPLLFPGRFARPEQGQQSQPQHDDGVPGVEYGRSEQAVREGDVRGPGGQREAQDQQELRVRQVPCAYGLWHENNNANFFMKWSPKKGDGHQKKGNGDQ